MAEPLIVSIPHNLGQEEAERRIRLGLAKAVSQVSLLNLEQESWNDHSLDFRIGALGQIAAGKVDVAADHVRIAVTLPWLLQRFADVAKATISKNGSLLLTKS